MTDMQVSQTIFTQLGGRRFIVMTGAKNFVGSDTSLTFQLPRNITKYRATGMRITLTDKDDYKLELLKIEKYLLSVVDTKEGVYCDNLQEVFTEMTGLDTRI